MCNVGVLYYFVKGISRLSHPAGRACQSYGRYPYKLAVVMCCDDSEASSGASPPSTVSHTPTASLFLSEKWRGSGYDACACSNPMTASPPEMVPATLGLHTSLHPKTPHTSRHPEATAEGSVVSGASVVLERPDTSLRSVWRDWRLNLGIGV